MKNMIIILKMCFVMISNKLFFKNISKTLKIFEKTSEKNL